MIYVHNKDLELVRNHIDIHQMTISNLDSPLASGISQAQTLFINTFNKANQMGLRKEIIRRINIALVNVVMS